MRELKTLEILKIFQSRLGASKETLENDEDELQLWDAIYESIAELEALQAPKTCESCSHRLNPNRQFPSFSCALLKRHVRNDFYCADYEPKDNA